MSRKSDRERIAREEGWRHGISGIPKRHQISGHKTVAYDRGYKTGVAARNSIIREARGS